jgi:hypothetical protein
MVGTWEFGKKLMSDEAQEWRCVCRFPDSTTETTIWMTQDGAEEMASETEQEGKRKRLRVMCEVTPVSA